MHPVFFVILLVLQVIWSTPLIAFVISDPLETKSLYEQDYEKLFGPAFDRDSRRSFVKIFQELLNKPNTTEYQKYLLQRALIRQYSSTLEKSSARKVCESIRVKEDDLETNAICVETSQLSLPDKRVELESLLKKAVKSQSDTIVPARIGEKLLDILWKQNDIAAASIVYKAVVEVTPIQATDSLIGLKESLALIYANPSNSPAVIKESAKLYDEVEEQYRLDPNTQEAADRVAYNKIILKIMSLEDFEGAIQDLEKFSKSSPSWLDSRVFLAFSLAHLNRSKEALLVLKDFSLDDYEDPVRKGFLLCYQAIALFNITEGRDLKACVQLNPDTQSEVVFHITQYLSKKKLNIQTENMLWRQFWDLYRNKLAPQMQAQIETQVNSMELARTRAESKIKDLELKNYSLLKIFLILTLFALGCILGLFFRLQTRKRKIEKLQAYIHKSVLSRFLPPMLVDEIIQGKSRIESEPRLESVTVIFADMVGFTSLAGQLGAESSAKIMNHFMQSMSEVIHQHGGTIDKFIGDAVMVIFGAPMPLSDKDQVERAVACAQDMLRAIDSMNILFKSQYGIEVDMRIGINQGPAIVGTFGSDIRSDYTAIGPTVNLASRIEGQARPHEILLGPEAVRYLPADKIEERGVFELKGIANKVRLFAAK